MAKAAPEIPNKLFYKIGEVCEITDTQPYVLRFWESEFPQLAPRKNRSGQRVYQRKDIETVMRIKRLLYEEEYTIAGARKKLDEEPAGDGGAEGSRTAYSKAEEPSRRGGRRAAAEADHPVDMLEARAEKQVGKAAGSRQAASRETGDARREARLEKALAEVKKSLREILALLRKG